MKPNMIKKWSIALLVAAGATGLTGCEGMRVDEGAGTATNNGNIAVSPNGAALKANLSGTVVDDFGVALSGVSVYAYGRTTTTDAGGNWILTNVPVTGVNINSTPQNLEQTTDVTTQGSIYVTYSKSGYAEYKSKISNPAVITHYGTAGGNPNSIIVDGLVASESVQMPQLVNTITGVLIDRGSYYTDPVGTYDMASNITVRLVPAVDVVNNAYGSAAQTGAGTTECYEGCGFYSVTEQVSTTDANGIFTFVNVPKIPGGYILRVDNAGYRPIDRPNDGTGYSYDYDQGPLSTALNASQAQWTVTTQSTLDPAQNYWHSIDFDVKTTGTVTFLEELYVGDYLVATNNVVEGITVGAKYGYPDENSGEGSDDAHNASIAFQSENKQEIDSNLVDLGIVPLKFIFSGDMVGYAAGTLPERSIVVFDNTGAQVAWDTTKTSISGRTLTLQLASTPTPGTSIYVRLHKDVFTDMAGKRLHQTIDPNQADYSTVGGANGDEADIAEIVDDAANADAGASPNIDQIRKPFYGEYVIVYADPLIVPAPVEGFVQGDLNLAVPATATVKAKTSGLTALQASDARIEELYDALLVRTSTQTAAQVDTDAGAGSEALAVNDFQGNVAKISFTAINDAVYRLRVRDADGITLTTMTSGTNGLGADEEDSDATVVDVGTNSSSNQIASTFIDFQASIGSATTSNTASVTLTNVSAGYIASIVRLNDFGDEVTSSAVTVTLADNFEPHVAIQNSNNSGQDTETFGSGPRSGLAASNSDDRAEMLFECGIETSDDNGEAEVGNAAYYFPKLNLSASLYDKYNNRAHTEAGGLLSTASTAEDTTAPTASLIVNSLNTPLIATVAATEAVAGTTFGGRNDRYYTATDYDEWGKISVVAAGPACQYYVAEISTNTGVFQNSWLPSTVAGVGTTTGGAGAIADDDNDQSTVPTTGDLAGYTLTGNTFTYNLNTTPASTQTGNIVVGPAGCGAAGSNVYDFDRTVILNMTEAVTAPADLAAFKTTAAACNQANVVAGSEIDTNLTAIASASSGFNNDHLLLTFDDWRSIDDSDHWQGNTEDTGNNIGDQIANSVADGSSLNDLMQIVGVTDANGVAATAGNGRGVLIVDATPPLATALTHNGSSVVASFDQAVSLVDNGEAANGSLNAVDSEFQLQGDGVVYTFNYDTDHWEVERNSIYVDRFGLAAAANAEFDITVTADANPNANVPSATANSRLTITLVDPSTTTGAGNGNFDMSDYFNELSHTTTASVAATSGTTPTFYMDYQDLEDNNFNSWAKVETYDQYDGGDTPRIVGAESQPPQLQTVDYSGGGNLVQMDAEGTYLLASNSGATPLTVSSVHATDEDDTDTIYTASTTGALPGTGATDTELAYVYGYASGTQTQNIPGDDTVRLVIKLSETVNAAAIANAAAFVYRPELTGTVDGDNLQDDAVTANQDPVIASGAMDGGSATAFTAAGAAGTAGQVGHMDGALILELPNVAAATQGDLIVVQNLLFDGHHFSLHIAVPAAVNETNVANPGAAPSTTESGITALSSTVYRHVYLDDTAVGTLGDSSSFTTGTLVNTANANQTSAIVLPFREDIANVTAQSWTPGEDDDTDTDDAVTFVAGVTDTTPNGNNVTVTLNALSNAQVTEANSRYVGHGAQLSLTVADAAANSSTLTIQLMKGHAFDFTAATGGANDADEAILNIISGTAIAD